MLIINNQAAE